MTLKPRESQICFLNILRVTVSFLLIIRLTTQDTLEDVTNDGNYFSYVDAEAEVEDKELDPNQWPESSSEQRIVDWAYSPLDLMRLTKFEEELYDQFGFQTIKPKHFIDTSTKGSHFEEFHRWWIQDYKESTVKITQNSSKLKRIIFTHPFLTLRMVRRFSRLTEFLKEWPNVPVELDLSTRSSDGDKSTPAGLNLTPDFFKKVKSMDARIKLPVHKDVKNVMKSILTMQFLYDLSIDQLIGGQFGDLETHFGLTLEEAFQLGEFAFKLHMFPEALDWLQNVYFKASKNPHGSLSNATVLELILQVSKEHDVLIDKINEDYRYDIYHRFTNKIKSNDTLITRKTEDQIKFRKTKDPYDVNYFPSYSYLCSGQDFINEKQRSKLYCWYERKWNLAWLINPLKVEVHSWDPFLIQLYDVLGDKLVSFFLETAMPNMERAATVRGSASGSPAGYVTMFRTSTTAALVEQDKEDGKIIQPLDKQIGKIVQLEVYNPADPYFTASEPWQVSAYAFGGEFAPHFDALEGKDDLDPLQTGDRIATFMVYLNNVQRGGYTVFPNLGVSVVPKKGSALFWYDLHRNGTIDKRTLHGGCPVILGQKWIATKWIRHGASIWKRPCSLNPLE